MCWVFVAAQAFLCNYAENRGCSLVVFGLLLVVASLVAERKL